MTKLKKKKKLTKKEKQELYLRHRAYMKAYQNRWLAERRMTWIKENGPCKHCGTWDNLEVDHINPAKKKYPAAKLWSRRKSFRDRELAKCQVLCKSCHLKKSILESKVRNKKNNKKKTKTKLKKSTA